MCPLDPEVEVDPVHMPTTKHVDECTTCTLHQQLKRTAKSSARTTKQTEALAREAEVQLRKKFNPPAKSKRKVKVVSSDKMVDTWIDLYMEDNKEEFASLTPAEKRELRTELSKMTLTAFANGDTVYVTEDAPLPVIRHEMVHTFMNQDKFPDWLQKNTVPGPGHAARMNFVNEVFTEYHNMEFADGGAVLVDSSLGAEYTHGPNVLRELTNKYLDGNKKMLSDCYFSGKCEPLDAKLSKTHPLGTMGFMDDIIRGSAAAESHHGHRH